MPSTIALPLDSIPDLAELIGDMPLGDVPAAWWISGDEDVLAAWDRYRQDYRSWQTGWAELLKLSGFPSGTRTVIQQGDTLIGVVPPRGATVSPRWWRREHKGYYVPRKRTREEKASPIRQLFLRLTDIPYAVNYLPGMPAQLWAKVDQGEHGDYRREGYPVSVRKPAQVVCAFVGVDPIAADPAFEVSEAWQSMKISVFHVLRERTVVARGLA